VKGKGEFTHYAVVNSLGMLDTLERFIQGDLLEIYPENFVSDGVGIGHGYGGYSGFGGGMNCGGGEGRGEGLTNFIEGGM